MSTTGHPLASSRPDAAEDPGPGPGLRPSAVSNGVSAPLSPAPERAVPWVPLVTGFCRVTVVTGRRRVDLAVPELVPVGELLPDLARLAGEQSTRPAALTRLGERPFDPALPLSAAQVRDGEVLYLVPRDAPPPPAVVEDLVLVVRDAVDARGHRWSATAAARALVATAGVLAVLPLLVALGRPATTLSAAAVLVLGAALDLLAAAGRRRPPADRGRRAGGARLRLLGEDAGHRAPGAGRLGLALAAALAAVPCWPLGAALLTRADGTSAGATAAAAGAGLVAAGVITAVVSRPLRTVALAAAVGTAAATVATVVVVCAHPSVVAGAAGVAVAGLVLTAFAPGLAVRAAGLTSGVRAAEAGAQLPSAGHAERQRRRTASGHALVAAALSGLGAAVAASVLVLALRGGVFSMVLAALVGVLVAARARAFVVVGEVVPLVVPAAAAAVGLLARALSTGSATRPWLALLPLAAAAALLAALPLVRRAPTPSTAIALERLELLLSVAAVPVMLGAMGVYGVVTILGVHLRH